MIEARLKSYLRKLDKPLDPKLADEFAEACKRAIVRQLSSEGKDKAFSIRLSQIGKPVCQQQFEKLGIQGSEEDYNLPIKFLLGDLVEAILITLLKASGVNVTEEQQEVGLKVAGSEIKGTLDIVVDNKVYDIKSCSGYAFEKKFGAGFQQVLAEDAFGYVPQLFAYAEAKDMKAGGWVVINKETGQVGVCEVPVASNAYKKDALALIEKNFKILKDTTDVSQVERCFQPEPETYYGKPTGKLVLNRNCGYCKFKEQCWGDRLSYEENKYSKAKEKQMKYYVKE